MTEQLRQRALEIHKKSIVIDALEAAPVVGDVEYFDKLLQTGLTCISLTVIETYDTTLDALGRFKGLYDLFENHSDKVIPVTTARDIEQAKKEGKIAVIMNAQNGEIIGRDIGLLSVFKRLGLRILQPTYYEQNLLGEGCGERTNGGLTRLGLEAVEEMNRLGMIIDCSHCGDQVTLDLIKYSKDPILATHSNARSMFKHVRNKTDEIIKTLANKGGVIGMVAWSPFCELRKGVRPAVEDLLDILDYVVKLVGPDHVGFGLDLNPYTTLEAYTKWSAHYPDLTPTGGYYERTLFTNKEGVDDITQFPELTMGLIARGYSDQDIEKILGLNFMRVFKEVWG